jgi:hypothetical protein
VKSSNLKNHVLTLSLAIIFASSTAFAQGLPTTGTIKSRMSDIKLNNGYPTEKTSKKIYDEIDFQRACQAYLWALPIMGTRNMQMDLKNRFNLGNLDFIDFISFQDKMGMLTPNATTPYSMSFPNMKETGPLVVEIPAGPTAGGIADYWQRPLSDTGQTGPDKGQGGKYLVLGPNDPDMKPDGYFVVRSPTINVWIAQRALDPDSANAKATIAGFKVYPYKLKDSPPASKHISPNGQAWKGQQATGLKFWQDLSDLINEEPVLERDRMILGMLQPLGIEKGKPFNPTENQKKILIDAAQVGEVMARTIAYDKRFAGVKVWPNRKWETSLYLKEVTQEAPGYTQLDERASWFYEAIGVSVGMMGRTVGAGQVYLEATKDVNSKFLEGGKTYTIHVPPNVPVAQFWSFTVYDNETRSFVNNGTLPDRSSRGNILKNADGSVDLYFGPKVPYGKPESNWIKTIPGRGWFSYFRLYGPTQAYFDRSFVLPDVEPLK